MSKMSKRSNLDAKKLGAVMLVALIAGIGVAAFAANASAHGYGYRYGGYGGYGGYGMSGMMGGMPMMGYGMGMGSMMGYGYRYGPEEAEAREVNEQIKEVTGKVEAVYSMSVKLDSGYYVRMPWWFAEEIGIEKGAAIKVKGFEFRGAIPVIVPTYIEVNGQAFGDESSALPIWMQGFEDEGYGYGYGYGYHCPMMGW